MYASDEKMKIKTIMIEVTDKEVDAIEDVIWCQISEDKRAEIHPYLSSFWRKLAHAFDDKVAEESLPENQIN